MRALVIIAGVALLFSAPAVADWYPGDSYNMHYPQLPDPMGWDVEVFLHELMDDWVAQYNRPITEIHFWTSWYWDNVGDPMFINVEIYDDAGGFPGASLWARMFLSSEVQIVSPYGQGLQGWHVPEGPTWEPGNHMLFQQINIENIDQPFVPVAGQSYWLSILIDWQGIQWPVGWKTSLDHFGAPALWRNWYPPPVWWVLTEPTGEPLSLAFVVGPGPSVAAPESSIEPSTWSRIKAQFH